MKSKLDQNEFDHADFYEKFGKIEQTVSRISEITESLRTFSSDVPAEHREVCELQCVVDETFALVAEKSKIGGIALSNEVPEHLLVEVNRVQFSQVLMNLLSNSLHAIENRESRIENRHDKWIKVTASKMGGSERLAFSDSGTGIDAEIVDKIMTPFYSTKAVGKGTGLGLSISLGIMRSFGGALNYVHTSPNTTFHVDLPSAAPPISE